MIDETLVMLQEGNERIIVNNLMFDTVDDKEMGTESSHATNDDIGEFIELMQYG